MFATLWKRGVDVLAQLSIGLLLTSSAVAQCEPDALIPVSTAAGFGASVAVSGDLALVGANFDDGGGGDFGSALLFQRSGGAWSQTQRLAPNIPPTFGQFGYSVDLDGEVAIVGAPFSPSGSGSAYFFERNGGTWSQVMSVSGGDFFGWSVAIDGDTAIVGGLWDGTAGYSAVYRRDASNWVLQQTLHADLPFNHDEFGWSVAISYPWAVVGAPRQELAASGGAYVFHERAGTWSALPELTPSDGVGGEDFGTSVAVDGQRILVGCGDLGGAYVFELQGGGWSETAKLTAAGGIDGQVALDGDTALVGAHVFSHGSGAWTQTGLLSTSSGPHSGRSAALDGGVAVLGHTPEAWAFELSDCSCGVSNYCLLSPNSAGSGAQISASGTASIAANDLQLHVSGAIPGGLGLFFYGSDRAQVSFGNGLRCVSGSLLFRLGPPQIADGSGGQTRVLDLAAPPANGGPGRISAGSNWNFQFYFRDVAAGDAFFNLSDGLSVTFCP